MQLIATLKSLVIQWRFAIIGSLVGVSIAAGGAYGWKIYKHRQSPEYALEKLNKALQGSQKNVLAQMVDFRALSLDIAEQIYAARPATPCPLPLEQATIVLADQVQQSFLDLFADTKDKPATKEDPLGPLKPLPADLLEQLAGKIALQGQKEHTAFARVEIEYPRARIKLPLVLVMENKDGWKVKRIANAREWVRLYVKAEAELENMREQAFQDKNAEQQSKMDAQFEVLSCTAAAYKLSDGKTAILSIQVHGFNKGPQTIHNMTLDTSLKGTNVQKKRNINLAARVPPGEHLTQNHTEDLDAGNAEDMTLLKAGKLQCTAQPRAMTLSSGEVLHIRIKDTPPPLAGK